MSESLYMDKKLLKKELIDYNRDFKQMMGTFSSYETVFDYINLITSNRYLAEMIFPTVEGLQKEVNIFENNKIDFKNISFDSNDLTTYDNMPVFKEQFKSWKIDAENNRDFRPMTALPIFFMVLVETAYKIQRIKECQKANELEEAKKIIEEIKEESFSFINSNPSDPENDKRILYGQFIDISMEMVNKFLIDEIDSQSLLAKNKPESNLSYNSDDCLLYINGKELKIKLKTTKPIDAFVLDVLFSNHDNLGDEIDLSEVAGYFDSEASYNSQNDYQRYRHACDNLNKKIAKQTDNKITDFILYTTGKTGWCKINKKYL